MNNLTANNSLKPHNIILEGRSKMVLSGISDVIAFEEDNVQLKTTKGDLTIRGNLMKMESFVSDTGDLVIQGNIYALVYVNDSAQKQGFLSRLFK